ncbi:MAG: hypothetical protein COW88_02225 [Candidatus Lloydbacteria bacterium CG22_combo_CG10-13_8_21_14_all_47_15]|uniref:Uncharacterized protein n=1 Tax=Candidatus Lloydbacteria bacterium CG22_combo_CG10-13_8_21_14_all_47_15 TaxID=1974635 RepID=A0A2H0CU01_9BACT|nr:MAG: hypothetical protein COW88_02225 [Candidatus Lloydbacteria bacterium CG22_combo_CG10-13_8_21_14_all_47_15]
MLEIKALQRKFNQNVPASEAHEKRLESKGEQLEILAAIALFKKLRNRFIVARTSLYDDYKNKVDMLIIERATNTPLCTIDEVSAIGGPKFEQKKAFTLEQNGRRHGATVKYGLSVSEDGTQIDKTEMLHIPSFYLPLPPDRLAAGMKEVELSLEKESEFENNFFEYFKTTIAAQTAGALFAYPNMDNTMKKRLIALQDAIANMDNTMEATTGKTAL